MTAVPTVSSEAAAEAGALADTDALAAEADREVHAQRENEAAYMRGVSEGEAKAAAMFEQTLADERSSAEQYLADERARWAKQCGAELVQNLRETFETLENRIADQAGRVLEPFVEGQILARVLPELRQALTVLLTGTSASKVQVHGPADLLAAMRNGTDRTGAVGEDVAGSFDGVEFVEGESVDIRIVTADTTIESQIHAWAARLREAVA